MQAFASDEQGERLCLIALHVASMCRRTNLGKYFCNFFILLSQIVLCYSPSVCLEDSVPNGGGVDRGIVRVRLEDLAQHAHAAAGSLATFVGPLVCLAVLESCLES